MQTLGRSIRVANHPRPSSYHRGEGDDTLTGTAADDLLDGGDGNDSLSGLGGGDTLLGNRGNDTLLGGPGDDYYLYPGSGNDRVDGGSGFDRLYYDDGYGEDLAGAPASGVRVDLASGTAIDGWGGEDTVAGVELVGGTALADTLLGGESARELYGYAGDDVLVGGTLGNTLDGDRGDDSLSGGGGGDTLLGNAGNDTLVGGAGDDPYLYPGSGNDRVDGGAGFDRLYYDEGYTTDAAGLPEHGVFVDLTAGTATDGWGGEDSLAGIELVGGTALADTLLGGASTAVLHGYAGDDLIVGGSRANTLDGDQGNDRLEGRAGGDTLLGNAGNDILLGGGGNDLYLYPGSGNDRVDGGAGFDRLYYDESYVSDALGLPTQGARVDLLAGTAIDGWGGQDTLSGIELVGGSALGDTLLGGAAPDLLDGYDGDDVLGGRAGADVLDGAAGADSLSGGDGPDVLLGNAGNDTLRGGGGEDVLYPGSGDDLIDGGSGFDTVFFDESYGEDLAGPPVQGLVIDLAAGTVVDGWGGHDRVSGIERLVAGALDDLLIGDASDNELEGGEGDDSLQGGAGQDTAAYTTATAAVNVDLAKTSAQDTGSAGADSLVEIENLEGSAFADTLAGSAGDNRLDGGPGADTLSGGAGDDTYYVDDVADEVIEADAAASAAMHAAGAGAPAPDAGTGGGIDTVIAQVSYTLRSGVENLQLAGSGNHAGTGNGQDNVLGGNAGSNLLLGLGGADILDGAAGADILQGGTGNDTLGGGNGNDVLAGGAGRDALAGGAGADEFLFDAALSASTNVDTLTDFTRGSDRLLLDEEVFGAFTAGRAPDASQLLVAAGATAATSASQRLVYDSTSGALYYDADGAGGVAAVQFAKLGAGAHPATLTTADFLVVD